MRNVVLVAAGGALGAVLRYLVAFSTQSFKDRLPLPLSTLLVNVIGCLLIGILATLAESGKVITPEGRNFVIVGVLGAFTTFSTFGYESITLLDQGHMLRFLGNMAAQLVLGFGAVWLGINLVKISQK